MDKTKETFKKNKFKGHVKGQVSLEMLMVVGFMIIFFIPLIMLVYSALYSETWKLDARQTKTVVDNIVDVANRVAALDEGTRTSITVFIPSKVSNITAKDKALIFFVDIPEFGTIEEVAIADVPLNLTGNWENIVGTYVLLIYKSGGRVWIEKR